MSGKQANRQSCAALDNLYPRKYLNDGRLKPYKIVNNDNSGLGGKTYERCGLTNRPFNHLAFYGGEPSPGKYNLCSGGRSNLNHRVNDLVSTKPSSTDFDGTCYLSDNCENGICTPEDHDVFYQVTGEQFVSVIQDPEANQNNEFTSVCGLFDEIRQEFASVSNKVLVGRAKRLKVWKTSYYTSYYRFKYKRNKIWPHCVLYQIVFPSVCFTGTCWPPGESRETEQLRKYKDLRGSLILPTK